MRVFCQFGWDAGKRYVPQRRNKHLEQCRSHCCSTPSGQSPRTRLVRKSSGRMSQYGRCRALALQRTGYPVQHIWREKAHHCGTESSNSGMNRPSERVG